ncbi:hypothetical protein [Streptomyces hydrogenans]|uniref:hypothetical protein n=1 Tax=Streptomyces hydrogenans TaxID=1873719 RepID=UPI00381ED0E0
MADTTKRPFPPNLDGEGDDSAGVDWSKTPYTADTALTWEDVVGPKRGCCGTCPIRTGCTAATATATACAVTGTTPPPAPPTTAPRIDYTEVASRGAETVISAAFGLGWTDLLAKVIEHSNRTDADGNPVNWKRLQLSRNFLCIGVATLIPLGDTTAARWVADTITSRTLGGWLMLPFEAAGWPLLPVAAAALGCLITGPVGTVCRLAFTTVGKTAAVLAKGAWKLTCSRLGWIVTRPLIWAATCGLFIAFARPIAHALTGAN